MSKCLGRDISVMQPYKSEQWAPCHIRKPSRYDWKIVESDVKPKSNKQNLPVKNPWLLRLFYRPSNASAASIMMIFEMHRNFANIV